MNRLLFPLLALLATAPVTSAAAQPGCPLEPVAAVSSNGLAISATGDRVAFITSEDPLGTDPGHLGQIFLWRPGLGFERLVGTNRARTENLSMDAAGGRIAFTSDAPINGGNPDRGLQAFLWIDPTGTLQVTDNDQDETYDSSIDASGTRVVFDRWVYEPPVLNPVRYEIVLWEEGVGERVIAEDSDGARLSYPAISGDGRRVAFFRSTAQMPHPTQLRLWDEATDTVETLFDFGFGSFLGQNRPAIDGAGDRVVFSALIPPLPDTQVFLWDEVEGVRQLTDFEPNGAYGASISSDGEAVAFLSIADPLGTNPSSLRQVFVWREPPGGPATLTQVTSWAQRGAPGDEGGAAEAVISRDGQRIAHWLLLFGPPPTSDVIASEIWLSDCSVAGPPFETWLRDPTLPGFEVQVRIGGERQGALEPLCIGETLCVSGAVPGRSEVFVRVVGPKGNGRLWPTLVKFTTSEVEVWIRQLTTGEIEYYRLAGARPGFDELPGLFDREGFPP